MRRQMKLAFAAGILLATGATSGASAADMAIKARPVVAPVIATPWTGCYIGGNVGGGWNRMDTVRQLDVTGAPAPADYGREKDSSFIGGGQAGCDFQTGNLVFGVQGQFDFGNIRGRHALTDFPTFSETNNLQSITTGTGRIGYLFTPSLLGYGKLGVAFLRSSNQVFSPAGALVETGGFWQPAITVGGGLEWMFAPNWSVFAEYNYMFTEDDFAHQFTTPAGGQAEVLNVRPHVQTALVGINYKFHWDGPLVAKY
ncbi:outer membrane protein [Afipia sp. GAS231]|uniref:outer membrane protein n=1 Tax=Afipia sp. GAS231 TaxID=1882747 RepID=UPI00087A171B|nr:outer membrane beta-barrel protein [Afipia sp. GAS231]SDN15256.1 outer membrane immunogenic protein [Afipia sp. GAS231]